MTVSTKERIYMVATVNNTTISVNNTPVRAGEKKYILPAGLYIVALNNGIGRKIIIH